MAQFKEGQEVEVLIEIRPTHDYWERAKIIGMHGKKYFVKFADSSAADIDADQIRPVREPERFKSVNE